MAYGYVRNKDLKPTDWSAVTKVITDRFEKAETEQKKKDTTISAGNISLDTIKSKLPYGQSQGQNDFMSKVSDVLKIAGLNNEELYQNRGGTEQVYLRNANALNTEVTNFTASGAIYNGRIEDFYTALNEGQTGALDSINFNRLKEGFDFRNKVPYVDENYNMWILTVDDKGNVINKEDDLGKIFNSSDMAILAQRPFSNYNVTDQSKLAAEALGKATTIERLDGTTLSGIGIAGNPLYRDDLGDRFNEETNRLLVRARQDFLDSAVALPVQVYEILLQSGYGHTFNPNEASERVLLLNGDGSVPTENKFYSQYVEEARKKLGDTFDGQLGVSLSEAPEEDESDVFLTSLREAGVELDNIYKNIRNVVFQSENFKGKDADGNPVVFTDKDQQDQFAKDVFKYLYDQFPVPNRVITYKDMEAGLAAAGFTLETNKADFKAMNSSFSEDDFVINIKPRATGGNEIPITLKGGDRVGVVDLINQLLGASLIDENAILRVSKNAGYLDKFGVFINKKD